MKIHLIKSKEVDPELFTQVFDQLVAVPGPIQFSCDLDSLIDFEADEFYNHVFQDENRHHHKVLLSEKLINYSRLCIYPMNITMTDWGTLFKKCATYRKKNKIPDQEYVILLTDLYNEMNWFASLDPAMPLNGFVHTEGWNQFINCSAAFPIAYEVLGLALQKHMFADMKELAESVHHNPIGCINDFCQHKSQVVLKLRTADICPNCFGLIEGKIPANELHHALDIMESLRTRMLYAQNFRQRSPLSRILINSSKRIFLTDFSNIEIKLRPLEKALYLLFLQHPEGIYMSDLCNYRTELYQIYGSMANIGNYDDIKVRIDDLTNVLSNSASEKISRIKRVFEESIGAELAKNYYIKGANGEKKIIQLQRDLVTLK